MKEIIQITNKNLPLRSVMAALNFILSRAGYQFKNGNTDIQLYEIRVDISVLGNKPGDIYHYTWIANKIIIRCPDKNVVAKQVVTLIRKELPTMLILE